MTRRDLLILKIATLTSEELERLLESHPYSQSMRKFSKNFGELIRDWHNLPPEEVYSRALKLREQMFDPYEKGMNTLKELLRLKGKL